MREVRREMLSRRQFVARGTLLGSAATLGALGLLPARIAAADDDGLLRFSDNFQRPDSTTVGNGWQPLTGSWAIASDTLQSTGGPGMRDIAQTAFELGGGFTVEAKLSLSRTGPYDGIAFNIQDNGDSTQTLYAFVLRLGTPSIWSLYELTTNANAIATRLPGSASIDIAPGTTYTVQVSSSVYGYFGVKVLDGDTPLLDRSVQLDPLAAQLAGGYAGIYTQGSGSSSTFQVYEANVTSLKSPSKPPPPPADKPLDCVPVSGPPYQLPGQQWSVVSSSQVDTTQSRVATGQTLLTNGSTQYVAYYDGNQQMIVAQRSSGSDTWVRQPLNEYIGWDAHNSVTMALDRAGQLHVAGDMHNVPLIYFRTTTPGDVTTLTKIPSMADPADEQLETYPVFLYNSDGALIYNYRNGGSGNGSTYYNIYNENTQTWSRLFDQPLFDGQGQHNSYPSNPSLGPDGNFHMVWVWRATADAATNSNLCYARSADLVNWETIDGSPITLPILYSTPGVIVDPVPIYGGLLNGIPQIGFDASKNLIISYYKFDKELNTQVYFAQHKPTQGWKITQASDWKGRFWGKGIGALPNVPKISAVSALEDGNLKMSYSNGSQSGVWIIDPHTLKPFTEVPLVSGLPPEITTLRSSFPGMGVVTSNDAGASGSTRERYILRWEALPTNNDLPRNPPYPDPSPLQVYLLQSSS